MRKKCKTVGELIDVLSTFSPNTKLVATGPDCGGYDSTWCPSIVVADDCLDEINLDIIEIYGKKMTDFVFLRGELGFNELHPHPFGMSWHDTIVGDEEWD